MSGNDERGLEGAENCPFCGFKRGPEEPIDQEHAYYILRNFNGRIFGFLNGKMGLEDYGGNFIGMINFENGYKTTSKEELLELVDYAECPLCDTAFEEGSSVFNYYLRAMEQGEFDFSP